jgi:hypothetical protein
VEGVYKATIAHYLPELVMGSEDDVSEGVHILLTYVIQEVIEMAAIALSLIDPTKRRERTTRMTFDNITELIRPYIKNVLDRCTNDASGKDLSSLIICSDEGNTKFYCFDKGDMIDLIKKSDKPVNPYTGRQFDEDTIERLKKRYM